MLFLAQTPQALDTITAPDSMAAVVSTGVLIQDTIQLAITLKVETSSTATSENLIRDWLPVLLLLVGGIVTYWFNKRLAREKLLFDKELAEQKLENDKVLEIEKFKIQQKTLKFTKYHAKQVEVLSHIYSLLANINRGFYKITVSERLYQYFDLTDEELQNCSLSYPEKESMLKRIAPAFSDTLDFWNDLKIYGEDNALYLETEEYQKYSNISMDIVKALHSHEVFKNPSPSIGDNDFAGMIISIRQVTEDLDEALNFIKSRVKELLKDKTS